MPYFLRGQEVILVKATNQGCIVGFPDGSKSKEPVQYKEIVYVNETDVNETKPTNPKDAIGSDKLPLHLWPTTATALGSLAMLDGALKYGRGNWRHIGVRASIYYDAAMRHLQAWFEGEDADPTSGLPPLAHALACLAIIVDAEAAGMLNDDRATPGGYPHLIKLLMPHVTRLKALHTGKEPKHYTIDDSETKNDLGRILPK